MIQLKRLNGTVFTLNADLIEQIESAPDTVITLTTGNNFLVKESVEEVVQKVRDYQQSIRQKKQKHKEALWT